MRVLFLAFMIALLPLRSWVGDAMAMDMLASGHETTLSAHDRHDGQPDCHTQASGHAGNSETPQHLAVSEASADCGTCSACQICHSVALPLIHLRLTSHSAALEQAAVQIGRYASADRAPGFKPPIL